MKKTFENGCGNKTKKCSNCSHCACKKAKRYCNKNCNCGESCSNQLTLNKKIEIIENNFSAITNFKFKQEKIIKIKTEYKFKPPMNPFPEQIEMGNKIFETYEKDDFKTFDFRILVPNKVTLREQIKNRLCHFLYPLVFAKNDELLQTIKEEHQNSKNPFSKTNNVDLKKFVELIESKIISKNFAMSFDTKQKWLNLEEETRETDHLMLIINDEAHLGIGLGGMLDKMILGTETLTRTKKKKNELEEKFVNFDGSFIFRKNIKFLDVSATPWNLSSLRDLKFNKIIWDKIPEKYIGEVFFQKENVFVEDTERFQKYLHKFFNYWPILNADNINRKQILSFSLLIDYHLSFKNQKPLSPNLTDMIVNHIINGKDDQRTDIILIRVQSKFQEIFAKFFLQVLPSGWKVACKLNQFSHFENLEDLGVLENHKVVLIVCESVRYYIFIISNSLIDKFVFIILYKLHIFI